MLVYRLCVFLSVVGFCLLVFACGKASTNFGIMDRPIASQGGASGNTADELVAGSVENAGTEFTGGGGTTITGDASGSARGGPPDSGSPVPLDTGLPVARDSSLPEATDSGNGDGQVPTVDPGGEPPVTQPIAGAGEVKAANCDEVNGTPINLPTPSAPCPQMTREGDYQFGRMPVHIYIDPAAKSKPDPGGPLILYYHATMMNWMEVTSGFGLANIAEVTSKGGVVAAFQSTVCAACVTTDDLYWFVEDNPIMDDVVACAIEQAKIDTRHIHVLGWSAGALHTVYVALSRSNYIASFVSYSGGLPAFPPVAPQDPCNHVSGLLTYGLVDAVVLDFPTQSKIYYDLYAPQGYYTMMCNHGGIHSIDGQVAPVSLKFFMDHPYKVDPKPYESAIPTGLGGFPSYCKNSY